MPQELFRIPSDVTWLRTVIRRRNFGVETTFYLDTADGLISVALDRLADSEFLERVTELDCLAVFDYSSAERGWTEHDRFEIRINDNDDYAVASIRGSFVRWGPVSENNLEP